MGTRMLVDHTGRQVNVPDDPQRIVSFSPAITEILFELGLGDHVVGVSAFCQRPPDAAKKRRVGSYGSARIEVLNDVKPDLILAIAGFQRDFAEKLARHFPVYIFELPSSVAGIIDLVTKVGIVTGRLDESRYMAYELTRYLGSIRRRPLLSGYLEIDLGGPVTFGAFSYITDALSLVGVKSIYGSTYSEWVKPDPEYVREQDPDVIFYEPKMYGTFTHSNLRNLVEERKWSGMRAVTGGRFFITPGKLDFFAHHGPAFIREVLPWAMERVEGI